MKIKHTNIKHKRILDLQLIKSRTYEQKIKKSNEFASDLSFTQTITQFKKVLKIIFKYHQHNKKILFIGVANSLLHKINKQTHHIALPLNLKLHGLISNNLKLKSHNSEIKIKDLLPKLKTKPDLIVVFNKQYEESQSSIITESFLAKIPSISFGNFYNKTIESHSSYNVPGNMEFLSYNGNIFHICLNFLFKKHYPTNELKRKL